MLLGELASNIINTYLMGTYRPMWNTLAGDRDGTDTDLQLTYATPNLGMGSFIQIDEELLRVADVSADHRTVTVVRGIASPAQYHRAGAYVEVNPRYPRGLVIEALRATVQSLPSSVYWTDVVDVHAVNGTCLVDDQAVPGVRATGAPVLGIVAVSCEAGRVTRYQALPTAAGLSVRPLASSGDLSLLTFSVVRARQFSTEPWDLVTDIEVDSHVPPTLFDALRFGTASRLLLGKETIRLAFDLQGDTRRADEVQTQVNSQFAIRLSTLADHQVELEAERLVTRYGVQEVLVY